MNRKIGLGVCAVIALTASLAAQSLAARAEQLTRAEQFTFESNAQLRTMFNEVFTENTARLRKLLKATPPKDHWTCSQHWDEPAKGQPAFDTGMFCARNQVGQTGFMQAETYCHDDTTNNWGGKQLTCPIAACKIGPKACLAAWVGPANWKKIAAALQAAQAPVDTGQEEKGSRSSAAQ